jgi:SAM-dependent methyltransferase
MTRFIKGIFKKTLKKVTAGTGIPQQLSGMQEQLTRMLEELHKLPEHLMAADGLPVPPAELRYLVSLGYGTADFFEVGQLCARRIRESLTKCGAGIERFAAILDFGCGCGRTIRNFRSLRGPKLSGTDYNNKLIDWCRENLPFATFDVNRLEPPLAYPDQSFDLVYSFSVFTHLPEQLQFSWMQELSRVLRAGGYLVISTLDEPHLPDDPVTKEQFRAGRLAIRENAAPGENLFAAYHPVSYVKEKLAKGFEIVEYIPSGVWQSFYLLKKLAH